MKLITVLENLLEQFDDAGTTCTIDVLDSNGDVVTMQVTPETEEAILNAYNALESEIDNEPDIDLDIDDGC